MIKTFSIAFRLRLAYKVNSILFALKSLPLIRRLLPASLYASRGLKGFALVIAWIWEVIAAFLGKGLYLFCLVGVLLESFAAPTGDSFVHAFFFLTLLGGFLNTNVFNPTKDKYYAIFLLQMDARAYALGSYGYFLLKMLVGFLPFTLWIGYMAGTPLWVCALMPLYVCAVKLIFVGVILHHQAEDTKPYNENLPAGLVWPCVILCLVAAYLPLYFGYAMPAWLFALLCIPICIGAAVAAVKIWRFSDYRRVYKRLLDPSSPAIAGTQDAAQAAERDRYQKKLVTDVSITSGATGYKYFHELFVRRHARLLTKAAKYTALVLTCVMLLALGLCYAYPLSRPVINQILLQHLTYFLFVMYLTNRGATVTQAMFVNCDHSMLTYRFYRQPRAILSLFTQRLKYVVSVNLLPALPLALGLPALLYLSGGASSPWDYVLIAFPIFAMSVFFSIHNLVLYYLLQPYNLEAERKSATYGVVMWITYVVCYGLMQLDLPMRSFCLGASGFCVLYIAVALVLAYRLAPRTFRLR